MNSHITWQFVTFVRFVKLVTFVTFVVIRRTLLFFRFDSFDSSFCRTIFDHVQSSQNHVMLSDDAQSLFIYHLIRVRDCFTNAEKSASNERNAISLRLERKKRKSHSTTLKRRKKKSHSTTLKKRKEKSHFTTLSSFARRHHKWLEIRIIIAFASDFDFDDDDDDCILK